MTPVPPENGALQQAIAEATARLRAQIRQDIAALRQAIEQSQQLVQDVRRERAVGQLSSEVDVVVSPKRIDQHAADE